MKDTTKSELEQQLKLYRHYVYGYGNASRECEYGYPQQRGLICGLCGHDSSDGYPCPRMDKGRSKRLSSIT